MPRFYCPTSLTTGEFLDLPAGPARHVQVLRLQPGDNITLFNGKPTGAGVTGEFEASITRMGRSDVQVQVGSHTPVDREPTRRVHLAVGMPANERMDWLVEKATELGVASIQPLITERSVLRLSGVRAEKKIAHWQSVAVAACEQCGANLVPQIHQVSGFSDWVKACSVVQVNPDAPARQSLLLSLRPAASSLSAAITRLSAADSVVTFLSGPEGGLSSSEEDSALACGFWPVTLGPRVLRAETAALSALAALLLL
jgi:16S rRNA (uracil1498-N3)-methyltransferase